MKKVLIVGGGFAGVKCALEMAKNSPTLDITLLSDKSHFEYHAFLYRVVTGRSPFEVCVPLELIFKPFRNVKVIIDTITSVDIKSNTAFGLFGSKYTYDYVVLAIGSQTEYFNIKGLKDFSYGFKSIHEALRLKKHIHDMFTKCSLAKNHEEKQRCMVQLAVVGAGPSGVELAGELAVYTKRIAKMHKVDPGLITIDLIDSAPRILPTQSEEVSAVVTKRLKSLGVQVMLNKKVVKEDIDELYLNDTSIKAKTIIWTAGTKTNDIYSTIEGLSLNKKGQVIVNNYLSPDGFPHVFIVGDAAQTKYSGMAQTAVFDGIYVARSINLKEHNLSTPEYIPSLPVYALPVGEGWAIVVGKTITVGYFGWILRRAADFLFFNSILPFNLALAAFDVNSTLSETCELCKDSV